MSKSLRKILIISGIVILVILLVLGGGLIYLNKNADSIMEDLLTKEYTGSEISHVYDISYDDISIGLLSGRFKISNLRVTPNESFYYAPDSLRIKYPMLFKVLIPRLKITGIDENFSFSLNEISLKQISIYEPSITIINHLSKAEKDAAAARKAQQHENLKSGEGKIKRFILQVFEIDNGSFSYFDRIVEKEIISAGSIDVSSKDLKVEFAGEMDAMISRTIKDARFSIGKVEYPVNGFYHIKVGEIVNQSASHDISILDFELIPQYEKMEFGEKFGKQTDRMHVRLEELEINGFDVDRYLNDKQVFVDLISVDGLYLNAFRDKNVEFDYNRYPKLPQQALADLEMPLDVREIKITDSEVLYEQLGQNGSTPGQLPIKKINGSVRNVSNIPGEINTHGAMVWEFDARFFAEGKLHLDVEFTKNIQRPDFSYSGSVEKMDMKVFNQFIEHTDYIRIESGIIQSMSFDAQANREYVEGGLLMLYDNLKIAGLRKAVKKDREEIGLLSAIANVVIRQFNPPNKKGGEPIESQIFFERDKNKGIFNYLAKGLISGIKSTILPSISSPKKRYLKEVEKEEKKSAREQRREERQKKRAAKKADKK